MESERCSPAYACSFGGNLLTLEKPRIMGIVNCTPDSFYDGDPQGSEEERVERGIRLWREGADILDLGGQSTRPGARDVGPEEEWARIAPVLTGICQALPDVRISVDTFHPKVADRALSGGAGMVNDVQGLDHPAMWEVVAHHRASYVLMHMQGTPADMQDRPTYRDVVTDVYRDLGKSMLRAREAGVGDLVLDVGFGFGKTARDNFQLLAYLATFKTLGAPLLVGVSRKSMIYKTLGSTPEQALNGTTALHAWALERGAHLLRVHDVKEARETLLLHSELTRSQGANP
jgi:dihydropteroate synthase